MQVQTWLSTLATFADDFSNSLDGLNRARLVIGMHHGNQHRVVADCRAHLVQTHNAILLHWKISHARAGLFERLTGGEHCRMFNLRGDDVTPTLAVGCGDAANGEIIRFGAAGDKDNFARRGIDEFSNFAARALDQ